MKQNQHQAGAKNSRRSQSKQARASASKTPRENRTLPKLRHVFGSGREDEDLLVSESGPEQFYLQHPPEDSPPRPVSRAEAVAWFKDSFVPKELKADFAPVKSAGAVKRKTPNLESTKWKVAALLHFMHAHCSLEHSSGVMAEDSPDLNVGMMSLCQDVIEEMDEAYEATYKEHQELRAAAKGGAR